jgi:alkaline phosphatase D
MTSSIYTRRSFLVAAAAAVGGGLVSCANGPELSRSSEPLFTLGVASGDPAPDGVVLWTRHAPKPLQADGGMPPQPVQVTWRIAEDEALTKGVRTGVAAAVPELNHSVHVEVDGLAPDRPYWYCFKAGDQISATGRTRTLPPAG